MCLSQLGLQAYASVTTHIKLDALYYVKRDVAYNSVAKQRTKCKNLAQCQTSRKHHNEEIHVYVQENM